MGYYIASRSRIYRLVVTDGPHFYPVSCVTDLPHPYDLREQAMGDLNAAIDHAYRVHPSEPDTDALRSLEPWVSESYVMQNIINHLYERNTPY